MAKKRSKNAHRGKRKAHRKNLTPTLYAANARRGKKNAKRGRRRGKRNPGIVGSIVGTGKGFFTQQRAEQVGSALIGMAGQEVLDQMIPIPATSTLAVYGRKILAGSIVYFGLSSLLIKGKANRVALGLGITLNIGFDIIRQYMPDLMSRFGMSGYEEYQALSPAERTMVTALPSRMLPAGAVN